MKSLIFLVFLCSAINAMSQQDGSYAAMLRSTEEIQLTDSLLIDAGQWKLKRLDTVDVKKWFAPILGSANNNRLKNRGYYLAGKITSSNSFDLLVLLEEKRKGDTASVQVIYLISLKKDGQYIASLEAAVSGTKKKSSYNTSSWLYKDFKVLKDSKITINDKSLNDLAVYKINGGGRFILYPNY